MKIANKRIIALILALAFIFLEASFLTSCKKSNEDQGSTETPNTDTAIENESPKLTFIDTEGKPLAKANFAPDMNSAPETAFISMRDTANGKSLGSIGFLWNSDELKAILKLTDSSTVTLKIKNAEKTFESADISEELLASHTFSFKDIGTPPKDIGHVIPFSVTSESSSFNGFFSLADYTVHYVNDGSSLDDFSTVSSLIAGTSSNTSSSAANISIDSGSIRLFDLYADGQGRPMTQHKLVKRNLPALSAGNDYIFEVDITVNALPVYPVSFINAGSSFGLYFNITKSSATASPLFVLQNTGNGLSVIAFADKAESIQILHTGKDVGDTFRLAVKSDGADLIFYVNDKEIGKMENITAVRKQYPSNSFSIVWQRNKDDFKSDDQNMDVSINSICLFQDQSKSITDNLNIDTLYSTGRAILMASNNIYLAPEKLTLTSEIESRKYGLTTEVFWESSNAAIIDNEGKLTPPEKSGKFVTMSMLLVDGDHLVTKKDFVFFAKGNAPSTNVCLKKGDSDPFNGKATSADTVFEFNSGHNSIVYDMGKTTDVNRATITSFSGTVGFTNKNHISLYYSTDNVTYNYVENFSMLVSGNSIYFYNFNVNARYIKVNSVCSVADNGPKFLGALQDMMTAEYSDEPLLANGSFGHETSVTVKNSADKTAYDTVFTFTFDELGISRSALKEDCSDIRFLLDGTYLPHYYDGQKFHVRVLELEAYAEESVKVLYGNKSAESVSYGDETFEVQYGTKFIEQRLDKKFWLSSVAEMPNGDLLKMTDAGSLGKATLAYYRSENGGLTWSGLTEVPNADGLNSGGGFIVDKKLGKVFYFAFHFQYNPYISTFHIFESDDSGYTWKKVNSPTNAPMYSLNYSDGITLSTADGDGPNVDYLITAGCLSPDAKGFSVGVINSRDGGNSWQFTDAKIKYTFPGYENIEAGMSEATIYEQKNGDIILYARCQHESSLHFAISHSNDSGINWSTVTSDTFSNIYTSNTQPILEKLGDVPTLMWAGNNSIGGASYRRFPLSFAYSEDDGETFTNLVDLTFQSVASVATREGGENLHTNPDNVIYKVGEIDSMYVVSTNHYMYFLNIDDHLYKTKGAFDSFENGSHPEGWLTAKGATYITENGATDGKYAMAITENTTATRSLHYLESGSVSFDMNVTNIGESLYFELQTAYNDQRGVTSPIRIVSDKDGNLRTVTSSGAYRDLGLKLACGDNSLSFDFDCNEGKIDVTLNGQTASADYLEEYTAVSFINIYTGSSSNISIDRFITVKNS